jgi:lipopolysaccharide/colanic/teichoic acid biosynthesis glycosyltransferase
MVKSSVPVDHSAFVETPLDQVSTDAMNENAPAELAPETLPARIWVKFRNHYYQIEIQGRQWIIQERTEHLLPSCYPPHVIDLLRFTTIDKLFLPIHFPVAELKQWANLCEQHSIAIFLILPECADLPKQRSALSWKIKRLCDRSAALILIVLSSPVLLALAAVIRHDSPGTIFFKQWRVGENGQLFRIYKFRTMHQNAEQEHQKVMESQQGLHKLQNDPRITQCGRWMRKYSLDELPQLFNVVRGEMSLVAPRPWALYDAVRISPEGQQRLNALPGITGAWQVEARSTLLDLEKVNDRDLAYLRNWSLWQDLKILLLTIPKVLTGFGAHFFYCVLMSNFTPVNHQRTFERVIRRCSLFY